MATSVGGGTKRTVRDLDQDTTQAPVVTHETVKPTQHEIIEENIEREIHTHDVYPRIQPILDREVLPPRHFVQDERGNLVEVAEKDLPLYVEATKEETTRDDVPSAATGAATAGDARSQGGKKSMKRTVWDHVNKH